MLLSVFTCVFFRAVVVFKHETAYEVLISVLSSDGALPILGQTVTSSIVSAIRSSADGRYRYVPMISRRRSEGPTLCSDNLSTTVRRSRLKSSPPAPRACGRVHARHHRDRRRR